MADRIALYRPKEIPESVWEVIAPATREAVAAVAPEGRDRTSRLLRVVAQLLAWAHRRGIDLAPEVVFHVDVIEHFVAVGLADLESTTQSTYRSELRAVGEALVGSDACPTRQRIITKPTPSTPYRDEELADLLGAVRGLTTPHRRENAHALMALGAGAGLTNAEINGLIGTDVVTAAGMVAINVTFGGTPRRVAARSEWQDAIAERATQVGDAPMFRPDRNRVGSEDIPKFLERLSFTYLPSLTIQRLRVTWIVNHLRDHVPIQVVAGAAGISAESVARYARFVPDLDPDEADRLLRGGPP